MHLTKTQIKIAISVFCAGTFLWSAVVSASEGGGGIAEGLIFEFAIYGIPLVVFAFGLWSRSWSYQTSSVRARLGLTAEIMVLISSSLFLLTLPGTSLIAEHEALGAAWIITGIVAAIAGALCSMAGLPRRWLQMVSCIALVPCWVFAAALFAKMMMD